MAVQRKDKKVGTLILVVLLGIIMGAFLSELIKVIFAGNQNVFVTFFTYTIPFGLEKIAVNFAAIKFQFGLQFEFSLMSIIGVFLSLYFFRWYK